MRLAVYNVENLFDRAAVMNTETWSAGSETLMAFAELKKLLGNEVYSVPVKDRIVELMTELGLSKVDKGPFVILRRNRGKLLRRTRTGLLEITANGRSEWAGTLDLVREPVNEVAMQNTARVIAETAADILGVIEAEHRPGLVEFNRVLIDSVGGRPYRHVMLIDGNDERGIDVGLLTAPGFPIGDMRSHVDDRKPDGWPIFSRDCPEFNVSTPAGREIIVILNHFKSKFGGETAQSRNKRKAQAKRAAEIYQAAVARNELVAVMGDFNDSPQSEALKPLLQSTDLRDISTHPAFENGGLPGTHGTCVSRESKIDYLLLSPALFARATGGGVCRKGMWPGDRRKRWETFPELTQEHEVASDHALIWADVDV
jgi:endonuclease/exonuclease/phosphatase family metal-dependent hydrolase